MNEQVRDVADYQWDNSFWEWDAQDRRHCRHCRNTVDEWTEDVPCCGGEYTCTDTLYVFACHHCRLMSDSF